MTGLDCACCGEDRDESQLVHLVARPDVAICDSCLTGLVTRRDGLVDALEVAPIFVTTDVARALTHYETLGFGTEAIADFYGFMSWGRTNIHMARVGDVDPATTNVACYLYVRDADEVHTRWSESGADGRFHAPVDTDYGMREGAHVDPDGNLIRFGSTLAK